MLATLFSFSYWSVVRQGNQAKGTFNQHWMPLIVMSVDIYSHRFLAIMECTGEWVINRIDADPTSADFLPSMGLRHSGSSFAVLRAIMRARPP